MREYKITDSTSDISLGIQGENLATMITMQLQPELLGASVDVHVLRPGESTVYPASAVEVVEGVLIWTVTAVETDIFGAGSVQIKFTKDGTVVKTMVIRTHVARAMDSSPGEAPDPYETWLQTLEGVAQDARESADDAETYAELAGQHANLSGYASFMVDNTTGEMIVTVTDGVDDNINFSINEQTGILEVTLV